MITERCGILFDGGYHKDEEGCIKPHAHNDAHVFKDQKGNYIQWEDDYDCNCGCWDDADPCLKYSKIDYKPNA